MVEEKAIIRSAIEQLHLPYRANLESTLGSTGCNSLQRAIDEGFAVMNCEAKILFENFLKIINKPIS